MAKYNITFCVTCHQKTGWAGSPALKMTRNRVPGLRGTCCRCNKKKSTFVTSCFYKKEMKKCQRSKSKC